MKSTFDIEEAYARLRKTMQAYPKAAMYQLAEEGYSSPFEQLVSCMISIRTYIANALRETNLQASVSAVPTVPTEKPLSPDRGVNPSRQVKPKQANRRSLR